MYETVVLCFVTRLPCVYYARFNVSPYRYIKGEVNKVLHSVTKVDCGLSCITNSACLLANHKKDESLCELISSVGTEITNIDWDVLVTNSTNDKNVSLIHCSF